MSKLRLLPDEDLERSHVVANCRMNRERELTGSNSYAADLRLNPVTFLEDRLDRQREVSWLDLCCGTGTALIQAWRHLREVGVEERVAIRGIDLVDMFAVVPQEARGLVLEAASAGEWSPPQELPEFDLITCVHGLHYIGDKLGLIARAASWLGTDGLFIGHLDFDNLKLTTRPWRRGELSRAVRQAGLAYNGRRRLISCRGKPRVAFPFSYAGADDSVGPNFTGQAAVDSYYSPRNHRS